MQVNDVINCLINRSGMPAERLSLELGHSKSWASVVRRTTRTPRLDTVADVADVAGCDVVIVDRETGATVATVTPPRRAGE